MTWSNVKCKFLSFFCCCCWFISNQLRMNCAIAIKKLSFLFSGLLRLQYFYSANFIDEPMAIGLLLFAVLLFSKLIPDSWIHFVSFLCVCVLWISEWFQLIWMKIWHKHTHTQLSLAIIMMMMMMFIYNRGVNNINEKTRMKKKLSC